jgi:uncharacterized damage-inducible protein DinB
MSVKELVAREFATCYDTNSWFVAVRNAIDGLNVEQACYKPNNDVNCIWESLSHLAYYNYAYLQRFKGIEFEYDVASNDETFSTGEHTEAEWQAEITRFDAMMQEFQGLIAAADQSKFDEQVAADNTRTWGELISDINTHNAYHAGQILSLRKLQGSWNPQQGVS